MNLTEDILFLAFRYCLGRRTYVVHDMVETLIDKWEQLSDRYKFLIQKEIKQAIEDDMAGMDMDVAEWKKVLNLPL